jgi:hypothetical protein
VGNGLGAAATEVFEGATVVEVVLEEVDDLLVGDVDYGGALVEEAPHVLAKGLALFLPMALAKLLVNCSFSWSHLSIECLSSNSSHVSGAWSRQKGKYRHLVSLLPPAFSMETA